MDTPDNPLTVQDLVEIFRVTEKSILTWVAQGMPVHERGGQGRGNKHQFVLRDVVEWYFSENYERLELDRQRTRLAKEQANKQALDNAERQDELGEIALWQRELERFLGELRQAMLAMPTKLAPALDGTVNERQAKLQQAVREILQAVSDYQPAEATAPDAGSDRGIRDGAETSTGSNGQRVGRRKAKAVERKQRGAGRLEN